MHGFDWHGGLMWVFWAAVVLAVALLGWWGNRRLGRSGERNRRRPPGDGGDRE